MIAEIDGLLRAEGRYSIGRVRVPVTHLTLLLVLGGFLYGLAMGSYSAHPLQALFAGIKVPLLLACATLLCLPSFFVLNTLLGLREDFAAALRGVLACQATVSVGLLALGPLIVFVYQSGAGYRLATLSNGAAFAVATLAGQRTLSRHYRPLLAANARHALGRASWVALYVFVTVQLAWVLRPFVGDPDLPVGFFRPEPWDNAYVVIARDLLGLGW